MSLLPSMMALLGLLVLAGYQIRDLLARLCREPRQPSISIRARAVFRPNTYPKGMIWAFCGRLLSGL
jgi:hypothetical protein